MPAPATYIGRVPPPVEARMQWPVARILLAAFMAAAVLAMFITDFVPGGTAIRPTLQVIVVSVAIIAVFRAYQRCRGKR
jgi:hypothetical protein